MCTWDEEARLRMTDKKPTLEVSGLWAGYGEGMVLQGVDLAAARGHVPASWGATARARRRRSRP